MKYTIKLPTKVKVGGHYYDVAFQPDMLLEEGNGGAHSPRTEKIRIDPAASFRAELLIHETLHAINRIWNNGQVEERDIDAFSEGIFQVLTDLGIEIEVT